MTQAVNELLKKEATSIITAWELDTEKDEVSINCDLVSLDKNKAVFTFHGMVNVAETAHPSNVRYAVSVNLNTGSPIGLTAYADADSIAEYLSSDDVVELVRRMIVKKAVAMDVRKGPLSRATENIDLAGLSNGSLLCRRCCKCR